MKENHFASWFRLDKVDQYLIWIDGDPDSVLLDGSSRIPIFRSELDLARYAHSRSIRIVNEVPRLQDLDAAERWLQTINSPIDPVDLLVAWNLFLDVSYALDVPFKGNRDYSKARGTMSDRVYDKLFYGNNIYDLTPGGEYYIPVWSDRERNKIAEIITDGLTLFRRHIIPVDMSLES